MKNFLVVLISFSLLILVGCSRQHDLPAKVKTDVEKPVLAARYPTTPEELALVDHLSAITGIFKVLYQDKANLKLVNASIYARVFPDECVLLGDLIFPSQSRLPQYPRFNSLTQAWGVDLNAFARQFWSEVGKRNDRELEQFLQTLMPAISTGSSYAPENGTAPPVSVYFPYSETFDPSSGGTYLPTTSLLAATADTDEAPGSEPVYENGVLSSYQTVLIDDEYASTHPTHIIGVNGPEEPVSGPGFGGFGGFCFGPQCNGWIPPPTTTPIEVKRSVLIDNYILKTQYDNLISFSGNGGGSEIRMNRVSAYLQPRVGAVISSFAPLLHAHTLNETMTTHTRQEISEKVWKTVVSVESRWDTSWVQANHEQALAIWEHDNTAQRTFFNGELNSTLLETGFPASFVNGTKGYSVSVSSHHPPIKHLKIARNTYFSQARNDFGFGFRPQNCGTAFNYADILWHCKNWSDFAGLDPTKFQPIPTAAAQVSRWPAYDVHWDTKAGAAFGWVWPYRVYYNGGYPTVWL